MKKMDVRYHKGNVFSDIIRLLERRKLARNQRTFCWCPVCKEDLCSNSSFVKDDKQGVGYGCTNCGANSLWNFDMPAPILIRYFLLDRPLTDK